MTERWVHLAETLELGQALLDVAVEAAEHPDEGTPDERARLCGELRAASEDLFARLRALTGLEDTPDAG